MLALVEIQKHMMIDNNDIFESRKNHCHGFWLRLMDYQTNHSLKIER
jgi:hypothetical protein